MYGGGRRSSRMSGRNLGGGFGEQRITKKIKMKKCIIHEYVSFFIRFFIVQNVPRPHGPQ